MMVIHTHSTVPFFFLIIIILDILVATAFSSIMRGYMGYTENKPYEMWISNRAVNTKLYCGLGIHWVKKVII